MTHQEAINEAVNTAGRSSHTWRGIKRDINAAKERWDETTPETKQTARDTMFFTIGSAVGMAAWAITQG